MKRPNLLIIDADDTLWESARFFDRAEDDFLSITEALGHDPANVRTVLHRRDIERLSVTGYGARPYLDTLLSIMKELCETPPEWVSAAFDDLAASLLNHPVVLMPGVYETIVRIKSLGIPTVIYTMGERDHQMDKFKRSHLSGYVNACHVVHVKTADALTGLLEQYAAEPAASVLVGNSSRSDINPALKTGVNAVHVLRDRTWAAEREDYAHPDRVITIERFDEIIRVLDRLGFLGN